MAGRDFYEVLGVGRTASQQEIRAAYRQLVRELHPDGGTASAPRDLEQLREVMDAYAVLGRPDRRAAYDATLERTETILWSELPPRRYVWLGREPLDGQDLLRIMFPWFR